MCIRDRFSSIILVVGNLVVDVLYGLADPRIRLRG